ncbi:phospholipid carrier-dependent glycosyltransferase [Streptomyces sp. NPDC057238]|uniref:phospholipid carrier-dependent glycosyltransferase n=1 Tax=Streptomyces sp. NPDC057238 TaxID=3346060 RepID=UPI00362830C5
MRGLVAADVRDPAAGGDDGTVSRRAGRRWPMTVVVVLLLGQMAVAMVTTAVRQTPTIDEPVYVGTAAVYLEERSLRYNPEHPPLGKLVIAAGVAVADPRLDTGFDGDQGELGRHLLYESGNDPWRLMFRARLPVIVLTLLFGLVVFAFARELAGAAGALAALALYCLSPDVIAHGSLATLDVPAAGFVLTSVWLLWRARRRPRLRLPLAGVAFGAALLVAFVAVSSLRTFPLYLPYSNEAFGGPSKTRFRLHDSNVDWGQDLGRLADRLRERYRGERIWLVYKGSGVPSYYGIDAADPRRVPLAEVRGVLVVSDSAAAKATGRLAELIDSSRPVDDVGHSITVYLR